MPGVSVFRTGVRLPSSPYLLSTISIKGTLSVRIRPLMDIFCPFIVLELLIDHAWGREPTTIVDIKAYMPKTNCVTSGQVLMRDYEFAEGLLIVKEIADLLKLFLVMAVKMRFYG